MPFNNKVFDSFPILKTKRLVLREIRAEDGEAIFRMRSNNQVNKFIPRPKMNDVSQGFDLAKKTADAFRTKDAIGWAALLRDNDQCIGTCGFTSIEPLNQRAEIGGEMDTFYWGKGIAQEAFFEILRFGISEMNLLTIEAKVSPDNRGAVFILEQAGFEKEGHFKNRVYYHEQFLDMAVYTLHKGHERL